MHYLASSLWVNTELLYSCVGCNENETKKSVFDRLVGSQEILPPPKSGVHIAKGLDNGFEQGGMWEESSHNLVMISLDVGTPREIYAI